MSRRNEDCVFVYILKYVHTPDFLRVRMCECNVMYQHICACMWYLGVCRWGPLRRSMLTRGAAGPPDVPIPYRLVTSGPLLPSLQNRQTHTRKPTKSCSCRLYIAHAQQHHEKLLYAAATVDLHRSTTTRMFFKGSNGEKH